MFERFNKDARVGVGNSHEIVRSFHDVHVQIEHLLLGLLLTPESPAARLLAKYGVTYAVVRKFYPPNDKPAYSGDIGLETQTQLVIRTARNITDKTSGDEAQVQDLHLLLGLFCIGDNAVTKLLKLLGCEQQTLCNEIANKLGVETPFMADKHRLSSITQQRQVVRDAIVLASEDQLREALMYAITWLSDTQLQRVEKNLTAIKV